MKGVWVREVKEGVDVCGERSVLEKRRIGR